MVSLKLRRIGAVFTASTFALISAGLGPTPALAHDAVVGGNPADGEVIEDFPSSITLDFSGIPKEGFNTISVLNQDQEILYSGEPTVDGQSITIDLPDDLDPGPGEYTVGFQITSSDGHATRGKTTFTVEGDIAASRAEAQQASGSEADTQQAERLANENASSSEPTEDSFNPTLAIFGSLVAILAIGAVIIVLLRRNKMGQ